MDVHARVDRRCGAIGGATLDTVGGMANGMGVGATGGTVLGDGDSTLGTGSVAILGASAGA